MAIVVRIPAYLSSFAGGQGAITVQGKPQDVAGLLHELWQLHPALKDRIVDEQGEVRPHINVFVGNEAIRFSGGLSTPVNEREEVVIVPAVSGG